MLQYMKLFQEDLTVQFQIWRCFGGSFLADEDFGNVDGQFLRACWWLERPILGVQEPAALWTGEGLSRG